MDDSIERSNGYLPLAPLRHGDPTAVGLWDVDSNDGVRRPLEVGLANARDQIVLARLHRQPLAILHVAEQPGQEDRPKLLAVLWRDARDEILRHAQSCHCLSAPSDAEALVETLEASSGDCPDRFPVRPQGHTAVIICTVGRTETLARTLDSVTQMNCDDFEVIVVDNRPSVPGTRALVESFASPVSIRYVAERQPGPSAARNAGIAAAANATYVAFVDDDVVVDAGWLAWLLVPFTRPNVHLVTGLVMPLSLESATQKRFELYAGFGKGVVSRTYDMVEHRATDRLLYPYWGGMFGSGNSMAFRREALLAVGGFDLALGPGTPVGGAEDTAAFTDVILAGGAVVYEPRSVCWHEHRKDEASMYTQVRNYGIGLTAVFWRYLWKDGAFAMTVVRSVPLMVRLLKRRSDDRQDDRLPTDLARIESRGRMVGPWRYTMSRRRLKRA